jgi:hypothetical protein
MTPHAQEVISSFEAQYAEDLLSRLKEQLIQEHPSGTMPRDAHPKMHGLVEADFIVHEHLTAPYRLGVFSEPNTYKTWVRFSNANGMPQPDINRDIRGIALKLKQVNGEKLTSEADCLDDQDFLLINSNRFLCSDVEHFDDMVKAIQGSLWQKLSFFVCNPCVIWRMWTSFKTFANPLQIRYFSSTPYLLGEQAVKYCLTPVIGNAALDDIPSAPSDNYLRQVMQHHLKTMSAEFVFGIQMQTNAKRMPVEDASVTWQESESPFVPVATLRISAQNFDVPERDIQGENMRFSPWHCLPVHRPLGSINRARRLVYHAISELRRRVNGVT